MPAIRLGYNTNTLYTCMEPTQALGFIANELGLRFVEFGAIPEVTYMMYGADRKRFERYFGGLAAYAEGQGLTVPVVSSWVRDNRDVTSLNDDMWYSGVDILRCLIDLGVIFGAERMISPAGTIRGYLTPDSRQRRYQRMINAWKKASEYAHGKLQSLEIEQMSWEDDPPQTIEQAEDMIAEFDDCLLRHPRACVPINLRYDVGHGPSPPGTLEEQYCPGPWFEAFPGRILGAHLKGFDYTYTSARPLLRTSPQDGPSSTVIMGSLISAIEKIPPDVAPGHFDLVMEVSHLKERAHVLRVQLNQIRETVEVVKEQLDIQGYKDNGSGVWVQN